MTRLQIAGDPSLPTAFSSINRRWRDGLVAAGYSVVDDRPEVWIHHDLRQHFGTCPVPPARRRIAVRTWDFGPYPRRWAERIGRDFDQLWVYSSWSRTKAVEAGVEAGRVAVAPLGVDLGTFTPDGESAAPDGDFHFLFVGALVPRKGIDVLLRAYAEAFGPDDRVCLTLKGRPDDAFYRGQQRVDLVRRYQAEAGRPRLRHIDAELPPRELAALYRSADAGVFPYRAEGFALPILEGMACGLPSIVPRFGACLDYCSSDSAFFVDPRRIRLPVGRDFVFNSLGFGERLEAVDFCEVSVERLAEAMRAVYESPVEELGGRGRRAAAAAAAEWSWDRSVGSVIQRLEELGCRP